MTDEDRQEIRRAVRLEVSLLLSQMLVALLTPEPPRAAAPAAPAPDPGAFDRFLGRIADAKTPEELTQFELVEREGPNRPEVFAAIGARMEALRGAAR